MKLECKAHGYPTPNITWTRRSDNVVVIMPLARIRTQDAGDYRCTADNGVGSPATADVFIIVHEKCEYCRQIEYVPECPLVPKNFTSNSLLCVLIPHESLILL